MVTIPLKGAPAGENLYSSFFTNKSDERKNSEPKQILNLLYHLDPLQELSMSNSDPGLGPESDLLELL